jgi:hypothetical protein
LGETAICSPSKVVVNMCSSFLSSQDDRAMRIGVFVLGHHRVHYENMKTQPRQ